jgi:hypothetical protein
LAGKQQERAKSEKRQNMRRGNKGQEGRGVSNEGDRSNRKVAEK